MTETSQSVNDNFVGQVLLAMPTMSDPRFERAVIYVCAHNEDGAMGIIINKILDSIDFRELSGQLDIPVKDTAQDVDVHFGGPVENHRGFVLHSIDYHNDETLAVSNSVGLTATLDVLRDLAKGEGPKKYTFALGYTGWGPGQLEVELKENAWLSVPASDNLLFEIANNDKWERAFNSIGVNLSVLSGASGHA
ncbi:MAG: YqgE/AlgH family protein [Alphaproteobacteria bacterium]|nr:YqgE/AlgH family protein [Alphaproteobacteria bacterium]